MSSVRHQCVLLRQQGRSSLAAGMSTERAAHIAHHLRWPDDTVHALQGCGDL